MPDEKAINFKVRYLYGRHGGRCGRHKREGGCALPGETSEFALELLSSRDDGKNSEESAEAIVGCTTTTEGLNPKLRSRALILWT
ncbi:MAG: hypothetical protein ACOYVJ_02525 [Nitrospirota bacterium]